MNQALKQRLVGAGVLLIFAGLLWPLVFDFDERLSMQAPSSDIPERPNIEPIVVEKPKIPVTAKVDAAPALPDTASAIAGRDDEDKNSQADDRPRLDKDGIPVAYMVRVGTFGKWGNADALRAKMLISGYKVFVRPAVSKEPGPYRVYAGPELTKAKADKVKESVLAQYELKAVVERFAPEA